ncbi:MAG: DUF4013 domain-containing protein [Planctomycetaceae bacterium]|nr:DUF4013 domain-containing protein [Planctomycetaceae bacterium]
MSQPSPIGPFPAATPKPAVAASAVARQTQLEYLRSFQYIFENPNWIMNLVWSFLCQLAGGVIPVLPALVFMGYQFEVVEGLHLERGKRYPDFDINRFMDYLTRGIWPFLVTLIVGVVLAPFLVGIGLTVLFGSLALGASGGEDFAALGFMIGLLLTMAVMMVLGALASILATPLIIRAGLSQDFAAAFDFGWAKDFMAKMWLETLLSMLFLFFSAFALALVTCGAGWIVIAPMIPFVSSHFYYQLYSIYLSRGGKPVPLKPRVPAAQPGYAPPPQY